MAAVRFPQATILVLTPELVARYNYLPYRITMPMPTSIVIMWRPVPAGITLPPTRCIYRRRLWDGFANVLARRFAQPVEHVRMRAQLAMKHLRERLFVPMFTVSLHVGE